MIQLYSIGSYVGNFIEHRGTKAEQNQVSEKAGVQDTENGRNWKLGTDGQVVYSLTGSSSLFSNEFISFIKSLATRGGLWGFICTMIAK